MEHVEFMLKMRNIFSAQIISSTKFSSINRDSTPMVKFESLKTHNNLYVIDTSTSHFMYGVQILCKGKYRSRPINELHLKQISASVEFIDMLKSKFKNGKLYSIDNLDNIIPSLRTLKIESIISQ